MDKIKASELLLSILKEVKQLKQAVDLQTFQYNLILNKLNILTVGVPNQNNKKTLELGTVKATERLPIGELKPVEESPNQTENITELLEQYQKDTEEEQFSFTEIEDEVVIKKGLGQKVPITQLVYTENNKPVAIASVEVIDQEGNIIKTKTNSVGRWSALVFPGKHKILLKRKYGKSVLEFEQSVDIDNSAKQTEILPPEPYRKK